MATMITAPEPGFTGPGPAGVLFRDGVAYSDDPGVLAYCAGAGYGIGDDAPVQSPAQTEFDARDYDEATVVGGRLRDAAVDPAPDDYLPPSNAGSADPHGPLVVSPEIGRRGRAPRT